MFTNKYTVYIFKTYLQMLHYYPKMYLNKNQSSGCKYNLDNLNHEQIIVCYSQLHTDPAKNFKYFMSINTYMIELLLLK